MTQVPRRLRPYVPALASFLAAFAGLLDIVSALSQAQRNRVRVLSDFVPGALSHAAVAATVVSGVLLLLAAHALRRRKRRAWRAVTLLLAVSAVLHVTKGLDFEEAVLTLVFLGVLIAYRDEFYAVGDPHTRWRALFAFVGLGSGSVVLGLILVQLRVDRARGQHSMAAQLHEVLWGLVGQPGPLMFRGDRDADVVAFTLGALSALTVIVTVYLTLRPSEPVATLTAEDEERLRALLERHGRRDSLGYFALRRDKAAVWSTTGKAAVIYRVVSGVCLASGDPIGDPEAWPAAVSEFLELSLIHAWVPAVMGCSEQGARAYERAGLSVLEIGDEAVVEVADFTLDGRAMRGTRQAVGRVERAGYTGAVRRMRDVTFQDRALVADAATRWRGAETERGFSMALGRFGDDADGDCVIVTAEQDGRLRALLHFVPWGRDGLSLDLMRRDREAENGLNEFLITTALRAAPGLGVTRISLNFAVFRQALERGERIGAGPVVRAWRGLLVFASRWFQIESLYRFNAKFRPVWEPRYVCYPATRDVPRVGLAALEAEAFIRWRGMPKLPIKRRSTSAAPCPADPAGVTGAQTQRPL